jgi:hypothetical protein
MRSIVLLLLAGPLLAQGPDFRLRASSAQDLVVPQAPGRPFAVDVRLGSDERTLVLEPHSVLADDFQLLVDDGREIRALPAPANTTYRGAVAGEPGSVVAAQLVNGGLRAAILLPGATWEIQPAREMRPDARASEHVVYLAADLERSVPARCGLDGSALPVPVEAPAGSGNPNAMTLQRTEIAIDADYELLQANFNDEMGMLAFITGTINLVDAIYRRDVGITYAVTAIVMRKTPVYTSTGLSALLGEFRSRWNANHGNIRRDIAHLLTGKRDSSGVIGVAYLGVICSNNSGYGVSTGAYVVNTGTAAVVAHELGHNWNAPHCDSSSPCNIMCSTAGGCSSNLTSFAPVSISRITSYRDTRTCLEAIPEGPAGTFSAFGTGCAGSAGTNRHVAFGFPRVGGTGWFRVFECQTTANNFLTIGLSRTRFGQLGLPFDLVLIGAPTCLLLNDHVVVISGQTGFGGRHTVQFPFPGNTSFIGLSLFSQFFCVDAAANQLGITTSNGYETVLGR